MLAPLFLVVLACSLATAAGTVSSGSASAGAQRSALAVRPSAWYALLTQARDLGPSRAASADVLVALRQVRPPDGGPALGGPARTARILVPWPADGLC